ncbi:hypothetical protein LZ30DRAFT_739948 [Colletotrichum cereale]|nr:hypothetical protein LZ30DRAFT_739948 [Colletotrichum cereale]
MWRLGRAGASPCPCTEWVLCCRPVCKTIPSCLGACPAASDLLKEAISVFLL